MDIEMLNSTEKLKNFINEFDPTNRGSVISLALMVCVLIVPIVKSINSTFIEEVFMNSKQKGKNIFFKLIALLAIFTPINFILSMKQAFIIVELVFGLGAIVLYIIYDRKEALTEKYSENIVELNAYYKEKRSNCFLSIIIIIMPCCAILMNTLANPISPLNSAVIVSVVEVLIICLAIPEFTKCESRNYFLNDGKNVYIYERIDDDTILCGDSPKISEAKKYTTISYKDLKEKEILHVQYVSLSKERKKELRNKYKENKRNTRGERNQPVEDNHQ